MGKGDQSRVRHSYCSIGHRHARMARKPGVDFFRGFLPCDLPRQSAPGDFAVTRIGSFTWNGWSNIGGGIVSICMRMFS